MSVGEDPGEVLAWEALLEGADPPLLVELVDPPAWHADAACKEHPDVEFFVHRGGDDRPAREVCAGCLVRADCLEAALSRPIMEDVGIWGGTSARQRRELRRRDGLAEAA